LGGLGVFGGFLATRVGFALLRWEGGFLVFGGIGLWMLYEVMRKGHNLLVTGPKETRKLVFNGKVEEAELRQFLTDASRFGYDCR
jgi:putative Mn2+ efflux pump MntP